MWLIPKAFWDFEDLRNEVNSKGAHDLKLHALV
jgi:hypothetical protein